MTKDDHYFAGGLDLTSQNIMAVGNVCALCAGDLGDQRRCSDAVEHGSGLDFLNELRGDRGVQTDLHAHPLHLRSHVLDGSLHLLLAGSLACQHELTTQRIACLAQDGIVSLQLQCAGSFQACNAACDRMVLGLWAGCIAAAHSVSRPIAGFRRQVMWGIFRLAKPSRQP